MFVTWRVFLTVSQNITIPLAISFGEESRSLLRANRRRTGHERDHDTLETPDGIKVPDFAHALAGPTCKRVRADLAAEVTKLETAPTDDFAHGRFLIEVEELWTKGMI